MSGKSGHRVTGSKPSDSNRTSAKTDGAFGKEGIDQLVSETERNVDNATLHGQPADRGEEQDGLHRGASRKKTSEADALHCPTCGRRFESQQGLDVHTPDCAGAKASSAGGQHSGLSEDELRPTHEWKSTP